MLKKSLAIYNLDELKAFAKFIVKHLNKNSVIALEGDFGVGKTTLSQFIIKELLPEINDVPSPTFNLVLTYKYLDTEIWHFDLYRLKVEEELEELSFFDAIKSKLCIIEWSGIAKRYLPSDAIIIKMSHDTISDCRYIDCELRSGVL